MSAPASPPRHAFPWVRIVTIVVVMAVVVSALWVVIRQVADTDVGNRDSTEAVASPVASPPAAPGTPGPATPPAVATPEGVGEPAWPPGSLPALLAYAPDRLADDSLPLNDVARYADIAAWMTLNDISTPGTPADPGLAAWEAELVNLAIPSSLRERGLDPVWRATYGFDLTHVEQVLIIGQAPDYVMILKGTFDPDALQAAWVTSGYQAVEVKGATAWSLFPGDTIDLSAPASRPAMGSLNNVVLLDDGTLVAAAKMSRIASVLEVVSGDASSLADNDDIAALVLPGTGAAELVSAVITKGSLLQANEASAFGPPSTPSPLSTPGAIATPGTQDRMPEANIVLLGIRAPARSTGATPAAAGDEAQRLVMLVVLDEVTDARVAREIVTLRLERERSSVTGDPYSARLGDPRVVVRDGEDRAVLMMSSVLRGGTADWLDILATRDLGFAFWLPEE